jgi:hypothetical protein
LTGCQEALLALNAAKAKLFSIHRSTDPALFRKIGLAVGVLNHIIHDPGGSAGRAPGCFDTCDPGLNEGSVDEIQTSDDD